MRILRERSATAPGKVVLWGEYAVLEGAPAMVWAIERRACATLTRFEGDSRYHQFTSAGMDCAGLFLPSPSFSSAPVCHLANFILQELQELQEHSNRPEYPWPFALHQNTTAFYDANSKLGIGSSAALCTALAVLFAKELEREISLTNVIEMHRKSQGGRGSGLDVAAAWHGGVISFTSGTAAPQTLPAHWHWKLVLTHAPADSKAFIGQFYNWLQETQQPKPFDDLMRATSDLTAEPRFNKLAHYCEKLKALDDAGHLGIYTPRHTELAKLASSLDMIYKPCGAGGGDVGVVFAEHPNFYEFIERSRSTGVTVLNVETAQHGATLF